MQLKSGIAEKIDATLKGPMIQSWDMSDVDNPTPAMTVPETGAGYEQYRIMAGSLKLTEAEAEHIQENFDSILKDKGFPAKMASGVLEVSKALLAWGATVKGESEDKPKAKAKSAK
jgi:hypothetical protein